MLGRLFLIFILIAAGPSYPAANDVWIASRGVDIPVTFTVPDGELQEDVPLVVLVHGHGGSRQENGGFSELASMLAQSGIASIRMDFPGCGESTEAFIHNNITNMLHDIAASLDFAIGQPGIDMGRVGILGYSMGGRLAMLEISDEPAYRAAVLWAPVAMNGGKPMVEFFGGPERYEVLRDDALVHGQVTFTTGWGQEQVLGRQFFEDLEGTAPLSAIARFRGDLLVVHGSSDRTIDPDNGRLARQAAQSTASAELYIIRGAGHGFGFFGDEPDARSHALRKTVDFFEATLLAD